MLDIKISRDGGGPDRALADVARPVGGTRRDGPARAARRPGTGGTTALPGLRDPVLDRTVVGAAVPAWPPSAVDPEAAARLWELSADLTGLDAFA
ncbi:hypothetical protein AT728_02195 [Streptomyces silvensis]|uniref:Uncharacterized protein n=1 Tax=Streptomyces silvensis TaxID=1765722 RepID=A0A0W7WU01_9ACTN|nr:hypothetical protein AT728_02195 [Streptomyces silvensis]